jgi:hypothetical protein
MPLDRKISALTHAPSVTTSGLVPIVIGGATYYASLAEVLALAGVGADVALSLPPATLNAGADTALTFASQVTVVTLANNTGEDKRVEFDAAASGASPHVLADGEAREYVVACTAVHVYGASASPVNGSATNNLIVQGRA